MDLDLARRDVRSLALSRRSRSPARTPALDAQELFSALAARSPARPTATDKASCGCCLLLACLPASEDQGHLDRGSPLPWKNFRCGRAAVGWASSSSSTFHGWPRLIHSALLDHPARPASLAAGTGPLCAAKCVPPWPEPAPEPAPAPICIRARQCRCRRWPLSPIGPSPSPPASSSSAVRRPRRRRQAQAKLLADSSPAHPC